MSFWSLPQDGAGWWFSGRGRAACFFAGRGVEPGCWDIMLNIRLHWALVSSKWWWCDSTGCSSDLFKVQKVWSGEIYHEARFKMRRDILFRQFPVAGNVLRRILTRDLPDCKHTNPKTDRKSTKHNSTKQPPSQSRWVFKSMVGCDDTQLQGLLWPIDFL